MLSSRGCVRCLFLVATALLNDADASFSFVQIRAELVYHNIVLYPFDTDENDEEELRLNERIRVRETSLPWLSEAHVSTEYDSLRCRRFRA